MSDDAEKIIEHLDGGFSIEGEVYRFPAAVALIRTQAARIKTLQGTVSHQSAVIEGCQAEHDRLVNATQGMGRDLPIPDRVERFVSQQAARLATGDGA